MNYSKPQLKIKKFDIVEDITGDFLSAGPTNPADPDNSEDLGYVVIEKTQAFNIGQ